MSYLKGPHLQSDQSKLARHETHTFIELLSNCLHSRPKNGPGGYSSSSFSLKGVLYSIRCMLAEHKNRIIFASTCGARLNSLMLKALARYVFNYQGVTVTVTMDTEAAEHCVFCLYMMSNHGFRVSTYSQLRYVLIISRWKVVNISVYSFCRNQQATQTQNTSFSHSNSVMEMPQSSA